MSDASTSGKGSRDRNEITSAGELEAGSDGQDQGLPRFSLLSDPDVIAASPCEDEQASSEEVRLLRAELARRAAEVEELRHDLSLELTLRAPRDAELAELRAELGRARAESSGGEERLADLEASANGANGARHALEEAIAARDREIAALIERPDLSRQSIEARDRELATLRERLRASDEHNAELEGRLKESIDELSREREEASRGEQALVALQQVLRTIGQTVACHSPELFPGRRE